MKYVLIILMMVSTVLHAETFNSSAVTNAGWDKLTQQQQVDILKAVTDKASVSTDNIKGVNPKQLNEWVNLGQNIGMALAGAAHELQLAVDEFIHTPIGTLTIVLIVWHFIGGVIMHLFGGILVLIATYLAIRWHSNRAQYEEHTYDPNLTNIIGNSRLVSIKRTELSDEWKTTYFVVSIFAILISILVMFSY